METRTENTGPEQTLARLTHKHSNLFRTDRAPGDTVRFRYDRFMFDVIYPYMKSRCRAGGDGYGVAYACWIFFLNIFPLHIYVFLRHGREYLPYLRQRGGIGIFGGLCGLGSYGIAIWAMTKAPIAMVAALRETSVIFGMLMAVIFLGEKLTPSRILAVLLVCCGTMVLKYG